MNKLLVAGALLLSVLSSASAIAQEPLRVGLITTTNGPIAIIGREQAMGFDIALKKLGGRIGGLPVQVVREEAKMTVETAQQAISKLIEQDKVQFLFGHILSNQILAYAPRLSAADIISLSSLPGPSALAGASCDRNLFVYSWENNTPNEAVGKSMSDKGAQKAFFIAQNYVTGREHVEGAKHLFSGQVAGEAYVPIAQTDFAAELASIRASGADAVFVSLPGASGIAFAKQFAASGLKSKVALFSGSWLADEHSFQALEDAAMGVNLSAPWFADLDNPANREFVELFKREYGRNPVIYAALTYDTVMALDAAIKARNGDVKGLDALRQEIAKANFTSVRGKFALSGNHFPIQSFYSATVVRDGSVTHHKSGAAILTDHKDRFAPSCRMGS